MKCTACNGRGYIEIYHGLVIRKCPECKGLGEIFDDDDIDTGVGQAPKPVRSPHTRKSTRSRKRQKVK